MSEPHENRLKREEDVARFHHFWTRPSPVLLINSITARAVSPWFKAGWEKGAESVSQIDKV